MRIFLVSLALSTAAFAQTDPSAGVQTNDVIKVSVTGDRVSLRATPSINGELLDRAMRGDELVYHESTNGWVGVQAPDTLDVWVSGEYVENGVVVPTKLNVRSGPSLNYPVVAVLSNGDTVEVRSEFNEWLKIAPPAECLIWISRDYVEFINLPAPAPVTAKVSDERAEEVAEPDPAEPAEQQVAESGPGQESPPPIKLVLDQSRQQAVYVEIPGVLRRANPGLYQLVLIENGMEQPICLVRGREDQMDQCINRMVMIKGLRYWVKDVDIPVVQPEKIIINPIITD